MVKIEEKVKVGSGLPPPTLSNKASRNDSIYAKQMHQK